jgi:hypothetical protein
LGSIAAVPGAFPLVLEESFVAFESIDLDLEAFTTVEPAVELADMDEVDFTATVGIAFLEDSDFPSGFAFDFVVDLRPTALSTEA